MTKEHKKVLNSAMPLLAVIMDTAIREKVHNELAPCTNEEFINRYLEYDPSFKTIYEEVIECEKARMCYD